MMRPAPGLVGRTVMMKVKRGETVAPEPCEVVACQAAGEFGSWRILVATHDGTLLHAEPSALTLVAEPGGEGPYR